MPCLPRLIRTSVLGAALIALSGCIELQEIALEEGTLQIFVPEGSCYFAFGELTPEGMNPELHVSDGVMRSGPSRIALALREPRWSQLPPGYGLFVDEEWILTTAIEYSQTKSCTDWGTGDYECDIETYYHLGRLTLTPEEVERLGTVISQADDPVEFMLQGFESGASDPQRDERFVYSVPSMFGDFLLNPKTTCDRWRAGYHPQG